jgi:4-amino-4-deoxy-L-arabinose transferase-like glycosyltransferase
VSLLKETSIVDTGWPKQWVTWLILLVAASAVAAHTYHLGSIPRGFYVDESSIGYNAWQIATTGRDEHGVAWPLYFQAFGEYKNPIHIYVLAGIYWIFGLSESATRAASCVAWLVGSFFLYGLCARLTSDRWLRLYAIVCVGFTPWLFSLSRVSFEVIWLYPLLAVYLWAACEAYTKRSGRWALVAGIAIALSAYAYSTFRLLAPLHVLALLLAYPRRDFVRQHALLLGGFAVTLLPLATYALAHSDALTARFALLTYMNEPGWSALDKCSAFAGRYAEYFGADFLAWHGDANRRHHTGYAGQLLLVTIALTAVGFVASLGRTQSGFIRLLVAGVLLSPIAAALTRDHGHSLRSFSMVVFAIPLSVAAAAWLRARSRPLLAVALATCAALQAGLYVANYFGSYPATSIAAFENYGFKQALGYALQNASGRVIVDERQNQPYIELLFFRSLLDYRGETAAQEKAVFVGSASALQEGDLFIKFDPAFECVGCRQALPPGSLYVVRGPTKGTSSAAQ